uniref:Growth/differentiation factor 7 n=1 Tax=Pogona vitticeps TaxID=103695 RepID=A0ABM5GKU0_9SAUR
MERTMLKSGRGARGALKAPAPAARSPPSSGSPASASPPPPPPPQPPPPSSPPAAAAAAAAEAEAVGTAAPSPTGAGRMELRAAAALCLCCLWSACRLRHGQLDAAAVRPLPPAAAAGGDAGEEEDDDDHHQDRDPGRDSPSAPSAASAAWKQGGRNGTPPVAPHDYMVALYHSLAGGKQPPPAGRAARAGEPGGPQRTDTVTGFADQAQPRDDVPSEGGRRYLFDLSRMAELDDIVVGAELRILRRPPENRSLASSREGLLHRLLLSACAGHPGGEGREPELLDSRAGDVLDAGESSPSPRWEVFDVGAALRRRAERGGGGGGGGPACFLLQVASERSGRLLPAGQLGFGREAPTPPHERALLVVFSRAKRKGSLFREIREKIHALGGGGSHSGSLSQEPPDSAQEPSGKPRPGGRRRRRTTLAGRAAAAGGGRSPGKKAKSRCSRKALHVNFKELGWDDWIIAPLDYEAYHCDGVCDFPLRSHLEPTNHAIIQTLMNSMDPEATPPSCCVPSKLSPISILYIDSGNNVVYKQYEDMVVESCGCR